MGIASSNTKMTKFETAKLWVIRALRDFPDLRPVDKREELIEKVRELSGQKLSSELVTRTARKIQNTEKRYTVDDTRYEREKEYRQYFGDTNEST
ncbi:MAG: hypothetical protein CL811_06570 [Colwelliaceae bacterium]|nr:hypothetical protein [Colwelliaceae bacterium]